MAAPVSILIPTRQEEENIAKCLASVSWADEVFVVDSNSTDQTAAIATRMGANVVPFTWCRGGTKKFNWALQNLPFRNPWVLVVDADEEVTPALAQEITQLFKHEPAHDGYLARFEYFLLGKPIRHGDPLMKLVLFKHRLTRYEKLDVPEVTQYDIEVHEQPLVQGSVGWLTHPMIHRDWQDLHHHFARHNIYSDWEALLRTRYRHRDQSQELPARLSGSPAERRRFLKRLFLKLPGKPLIYFLYSYLFRLGFLDGRQGFTYNLLKSMYWYQVSLKEYEIKLRERDAGGRLPESHEYRASER